MVARYVATRTGQTIVVMLLASAGIFAMIRAIPGDPAVIEAGPEASAAQITAMRHTLGLDQPLPIQYLAWLRRILTGHIGTSFSTHSAVAGLIGAAIEPTVYLLVLSMLIGVAAGLGLGLVMVYYRRRWQDTAVGIGVSAIYGIPPFWLGLLGILLFGIKLRWLPTGGYVSPSTSVAAAIRSLILPSTVLGLGFAGELARFVRASALDTITDGYVLTARAKGLTHSQVLHRHVARNALLPVVTVIGLQFGKLLGGAVVIEAVFAIPGMGLLVLTAIGQRDYTTLQAVLLLFMASFAVVNLLTDLSYHLIDPRLRR